MKTVGETSHPTFYIWFENYFYYILIVTVCYFYKYVVLVGKEESGNSIRGLYSWYLV